MYFKKILKIHSNETLSGKLSTFEEIKSAEPLLGPLLFIAFTLFVVVILVNLFIAIIMNAYSTARREAAEMNEAGLLEYVLDCSRELLDMLGIASGRRAESAAESYLQGLSR